MTKIDKGTRLEGRIQRLVFAQGVFAERSLVPAASDDHRLLATDIDVLACEYNASFHVTKSHFECKSGKIQPLDRVLWLSGVRKLLDADTSSLVIQKADQGVIDFARSQGIDIVTDAELSSLEESLSISRDRWVGRSNVELFCPLRSSWSKAFNNNLESPEWQLLRNAISFVEIDSWYRLSFRETNALLRLLEEVAKIATQSSKDEHLHCCAVYCLNALTVRFSQAILAICRETRSMTKQSRTSFLEQKLSFGETNPKQARGLMEGTLALVRESLKKQGHVAQLEIDMSRLLGPPSYTKDFVALINHLIARPQEARYLVVATEMGLFGKQEEVAVFPALAEVVDKGDEVAAILNGFVQRLCHLPSQAVFSSLSTLAAEGNG